MLVRQTALQLARSGARSLATSAIRGHAPLTDTCSSPHFFDAVHKGTIPSFRLLGPDGLLVKDAEAEWVERAKAEDGEKLERMLEVMTMLPILVRPLSSSRTRSTRRPVSYEPDLKPLDAFRTKSSTLRNDKAAFPST